MTYNRDVDKEVKLLDLNYDEGDIYKSIMNDIFIKPKTGTPNIIEVVLGTGGDLILWYTKFTVKICWEFRAQNPASFPVIGF